MLKNWIVAMRQKLDFFEDKWEEYIPYEDS